MARPTIRDVAQKAGYSIATVSLVLNHKNVSIPNSTREKIWAVVKELNYRPNQLAVSMVTKKSKVLGLIIPDNSNAFFADISKAIERAARHAGYGLIYGNSNNDSRRDLQYMRMFSDRQVDGIIFAKSTSVFEEDDEKSLQFMKNSVIPFVTIDRQVPGSEVRSVMLNHFKGGYLATRHLIQLGHRRIGAYTGPSDLQNSNERLEGYRSALAEAGIVFDPALIFEGDYQLGQEEAAFTHFLNQKVSAVFCFNDLMAFGLYREMRRAGLSIPDDLSIVGFDNIFFSDIIQPALTTIGQPITEMGKCVVETLLGIIEGDPSATSIRRHQVFEPKLLVRESTKQFEDRSEV